MLVAPRVSLNVSSPFHAGVNKFVPGEEAGEEKHTPLQLFCQRTFAFSIGVLAT
jgi:hypothetical protein